jgi:hypothetical protein
MCEIVLCTIGKAHSQRRVPFISFVFYNALVHPFVMVVHCASLKEDMRMNESSTIAKAYYKTKLQEPALYSFRVYSILLLANKERV